MSCYNSTNIFLLGLVSGMTSDIRTSSIDQQPLMTFAYIFSVTLLFLFGIISNILSIGTFYQIQIRTTTVGFYLIVYSLCSIFGIIMLECRLIRMLSSLSYAIAFSICSIVSGLASIFTRICLWMIAFIALQRSVHSFKPNRLLNIIRSRGAAQKQIIILIVAMILMHIHEIASRVSLPDPSLKGNFICQIIYTRPLMTLNDIFSFIHMLVPVLLNMLANCLILASISRRRATLHQTSYWAQWLRHFRRHRHLFLPPTLAIICTLPQLILSLTHSCVNISVKWLLRFNTAANLIIYIPQAATFFLFILFSKSYLETFKRQTYLGKLLLRCCCRFNNTIVPQNAMADESLMETRRQQNPAGTIELCQQSKTRN